MSPNTLDKPLPVRTFDIPRNTTGDKLSIRVTEPAVKADNLVLETWASSTVLASQLHRLPIHFPEPSPDDNDDATAIIPLLELGAGTGVVGIAAAVIYNQDVVLTDLAPIVPALASNAALNADLLASSSSSSGDHTSSRQAARVVSAGVLDWTCPTVLHVHTPPSHARAYPVATTKAHVLLAADTLYSPEHPALLSRTIAAWLSRDARARLVLGTAMRVAYLDELRELWAALEGVGLEVEWEGRDMAAEGDFDDERLVEVSLWRWKREDGEGAGEGALAQSATTPVS